MRALGRKNKRKPITKAANSARKRIKKALKNPIGVKFCVHFGCSKKELIAHLESLFQEGMSWDNYGRIWHIDHIVPLAAAKGDKTLLRKMNHFRNLQPLTAADNQAKGHNIPEVWPTGLPFTRYDFGLHSPWEAQESLITCPI